LSSAVRRFLGVRRAAEAGAAAAPSGARVRHRREPKIGWQSDDSAVATEDDPHRGRRRHPGHQPGAGRAGAGCGAHPVVFLVYIFERLAVGPALLLPLVICFAAGGSLGVAAAEHLVQRLFALVVASRQRARSRR
jgi:hypothetical protein